MHGRDVNQATQLLELARSAPRELLATGDHARDDEFGPLATAIRLRALGIAHRDAGNTDRALEYLRQAASVASTHGLADELAEARLTLASVLFLTGSPGAALESLSLAESGATDHLRAKIDFQRATIHSRSGSYRRAVPAFERAITHFMRLGDRRFEGMARRNLGRLALGQGDLNLATENLERARELFHQIGSTVQLPFIDHDLALTQMRRGEIMSALQRLAAAEQEIEAAGGSAVHIQLDRCEAFLAAGLFRDARNLARSIGPRMQQSGMQADHAEALLMEATAALLAGDAAGAASPAARAIDVLIDQERPGWLAAAKHTELESRVRSGDPAPRHLDEALELLGQLADAGHFVRSAQLDLLIVGLALRLGEQRLAAEAVARLDLEHGPVEVRVGAWLARAQLAAHSGDRPGALRAAGTGMRLLERHQALIGASDVRAGLSIHGKELGELALKATVLGGRPRAIFNWLERTRAKALLTQPLRPSEHSDLEQELTELRSLSARMRRAAPHQQATLVAAMTRAQARVRRISHRLPPSGPMILPNRAEDLLGVIGDRVLAQIGIVDDAVWAVVLEDGRARKLSVGPAQTIIEAADDARRNLQSAARPGPNRGQHLEAAKRAGRELDQELVEPLRLPADRSVVFVPPAGFFAAPWGLVPSLSSRAFSVAPSATLWHLAGSAGYGTGVLSVAGPGLRHASEESLLTSRVHRSAVRFSSRNAQTREVQRALAGTRLAHFACHGQFDVEQPLLSTVTLADGDLTTYDLSGLERSPSIMVLASCETGRSGGTAGEELVGLAGTLLSAGVKAVVASVGEIPDSSATVRLMVKLHEALRDGATVAKALLEVRRAAKSPVAQVVANSLVCFGYGEATLTA